MLSARCALSPSKSFYFSQRDKDFSGKLQQKELEWQSDIAQLRSTFANEKADLEAELKNAKAEENKLKDKLMEAEGVSNKDFSFDLNTRVD